MKYEVKDLNAPSRWNMRIWDDDNGEWLCQSDKNALTYYGFDITGGEITEFQGLPKWHAGRHLIWEQSTGLKDSNGKEVYEGDIVEAMIDGVWGTGNFSVSFGKVKWKLEVVYNDIRYMDVFRVIGSKNSPDRIYYLFDKELSELEVIGNIHENPELLEINDVD